MDNNTILDGAQQSEARSASANFSRHSPSIQPLTPEDEIREEAASVVPRIPLPGESSDETVNTSSYTPGGNRSNLDSLTAEDIRDDF